MKLLMSSLALCAFSACASQGPEGGGGGADGGAISGTSSAPRLVVRLTDAPAAFDHVWVDISKVEVSSATSGWLTVTETPARFDLLALRDDVTAALGDAQLEAGAYQQLRLFVDAASVVVAGVESPLKIASGAQTGIKINLDTTFEAGMTYAIVLDFDAGKSVKTTGQGFLMTPVIEVKSFTATPTAPADGGAGEGSGSGSDDGSGSGSDGSGSGSDGSGSGSDGSGSGSDGSGSGSGSGSDS